MLEGFHGYRSPFDVRPERQIRPNVYRFDHGIEDLKSRGEDWRTPHEKWVDMREWFSENGSPHRLEKMLEHVTLDNPPPAKDLYRRQATTEDVNHSRTDWVISVMAGAFVLGMAFLGAYVGALAFFAVLGFIAIVFFGGAFVSGAREYLKEQSAGHAGKE